MAARGTRCPASGEGRWLNCGAYCVEKAHRRKGHFSLNRNLTNFRENSISLHIASYQFTNLNGGTKQERAFTGGLAPEPACVIKLNDRSTKSDLLSPLTPNCSRNGSLIVVLGTSRRELSPLFIRHFEPQPYHASQASRKITVRRREVSRSSPSHSARLTRPHGQDHTGKFTRASSHGQVHNCQVRIGLQQTTVSPLSSQELLGKCHLCLLSEVATKGPASSSRNRCTRSVELNRTPCVCTTPKSRANMRSWCGVAIVTCSAISAARTVRT